MDGENVFQSDFPEAFNLILGNEGNGIRPVTEELADKRLAFRVLAANRILKV